MEGHENFESNESYIDGLIEGLATGEGMDSEAIISDIVTFAAILEEDDGVSGYFEELAERLGIPYEQIIEYARKKTEGTS
jgi:hypothetical protein